jgi:hypothetical protein
MVMLLVIEPHDRHQQWLGVADLMQAEVQEAANAILDRFATRANGAGITPGTGDPRRRLACGRRSPARWRRFHIPRLQGWRGLSRRCPSSTATLRHDIQNLLRHFIPDVTEVRRCDRPRTRPIGRIRAVRRERDTAVANAHSGDESLTIDRINTYFVEAEFKTTEAVIARDALELSYFEVYSDY